MCYENKKKDYFICREAERPGMYWIALIRRIKWPRDVIHPLLPFSNSDNRIFIYLPIGNYFNQITTTHILSNTKLR